MRNDTRKRFARSPGKQASDAPLTLAANSGSGEIFTLLTLMVAPQDILGAARRIAPLCQFMLFLYSHRPGLRRLAAVGEQNHRSSWFAVPATLLRKVEKSHQVAHAGLLVGK